VRAVGSMQKNAQSMWVWSEAAQKIEQREVTYVPGLYKIFDEILVNAADNKQRDATMTTIRVTIDQAAGTVAVWNDGRGIPVVMHGEHSVYVPELIFGHLLTSSNYDDSEKKVTGGRNGYGAKLANIFSKEFVIETCDTSRGLKYRQVFTDNMSVKGAPEIAKTGKSDRDFTCVTFTPDLKRFGMECLDEDIVSLFTKRVYDVAGVTDRSVSVFLNGRKLAVRDFESYVNLYFTDADAEAASSKAAAAADDDSDDSDDSDDFDDESVGGKKKKKKAASAKAASATDEKNPRMFCNVNDRWEVAMSVSDGQFTQVSFVNSICTTRGGTHVKHVADQIAEAVCKAASRKNKGVPLKVHHVRNHMTVFVNCLIENPAFDSQTKDTLITTPKTFGSACELPEKYLKTIISKSGIVDAVLSWAKFKQNAELKRKGGVKTRTLVGIPKLDDANNAGTAKAEQCTLILTEGDSAKALAISGLSVVGRDNYGVFPLKGKLLNVREASHKQIMANAEIQNIVKILGLQFGKEYESAKGLRYGHLMIMADQDHDGSHIKGLIINFLHHFWPSLLKIDGFLQQFITPIVKVTRGSKAVSFFTLPEYRAWRESASAKGWAIKYYKGLGTSTAKEAKEYFADLKTHVIDFAYDESELRRLPTPSSEEEEEDMEAAAVGDDAMSIATIEDGNEENQEEAVAASSSSSGRAKKSKKSKEVKLPETDPDLIDLAFSKKRADDRKHWLQSWRPETHVDYAVEAMPVGTFVDKELILFSRADNERSIPSFMDGLKPSQRKVLFSCFKRGLKKDIKVAQLAGYVAEHSAYHHGEASLAATIIGMAQDFVGSNNINLLVPSGQFGTRILGGKDAASARYVFTRLHDLARLLFPALDDPLLKHLNDDGQTIEPEFYAPVIPLALVNGADGIGTGWSTFVPTFDPRTIIDAVRAEMRPGSAPVELTPFFRGFEGTVSPGKDAGQYIVSGRYDVSPDGTVLTVSELPVRKWTQDYKTFLESLTPQATKEKEKEVKKKAPAKPKAPTKKKTTKKTAGDDDVSDTESLATAVDEAAPVAPAAVPLVKEFRENHTDTSVSFTIMLTPEGQKIVSGGDTMTRKKFKLDTTISTGNMHLFDEHSRIRRFATPLAVVRRFVPIRLAYYEKRRQYCLEQLRNELDLLRSKEQFIEAVLDGSLVVSRRCRDDVVADLIAMGLKPRNSPLSKAKAASSGPNEDEEEDEQEEDVDAKSLAKGFNYLLSMPLLSLTAEKVTELRIERINKQDEVKRLEGTTACDLWEEDLAALEEGLDQDDLARAQLIEEEERARRKAQGKGAARRQTKRATKKPSKKVAAYEESDDEDDLIELDDDDDFEAPKPIVAKKPRAAPKKQVNSSSSSSSLVRAVAKPPQPSAVADSDSEEEILSLAERIAVKMAVTPEEKQSKPQRKAAKATKAVVRKPAIVDDDSDVFNKDTDEESDFDEDKPKARKAVKRAVSDERKAVKAGKAIAVGSPTAKSPAPKRTKAKTAANGKTKATAAAGGKKKRKTDDNEDDDDDDIEVVEVTKAPRAKRAVAAARTKYIELSDEEEEEDDFVDEESEEEDFDDDFE
jgi:DNA topoisomerase II